MKTVFYTFILMVGILSCRSVDKMVEKGEYDKAFDYALSKLQGEKNKKTEYVKAIEKAYFKLNGASLHEIDKLNPLLKPENWHKALNIYKSLEARQERLEPLLPLVSEDKYKATFDLRNYSEEIKNAEENTCLYYYNNAKSLLSKSERTGNKAFARDAYDEFLKIEPFRINYKDAENLKENALVLGANHIQIDIFNNLSDFHSSTIEQMLLSIPVSRLNDRWHYYYLKSETRGNIDYFIVMELNDIYFTPERERQNNYIESKEILVKKDKVKEKRDSGEVWVEKEVYEKVKADISEIFREKESELHGKISVVNARTKENIKTIPVNVFNNFKGYGCKFIGDERALTAESKKKLDGYCESFPSDFDMADELAVAFRKVLLDEIGKITYQ
ncbi:MAG: hypothetical protein WBP08_16475 [Saprospiraceae bacterium]